MNIRDRYTVDILDPPAGWDDRKIEIRHRNIEDDQVGPAVLVLLAAAERLWRQSKAPTRAPTVTVRRVGAVVGQQIEMNLKERKKEFSSFSEEKEGFIAP